MISQEQDGPETDFERLGGDARLRRVLSDFLERIRKDVMIGFHFQGVDFVRLLELELEFARQHLGGPGTYGGRPLHAAHAGHRILGGHFDRRLRLLEQTLEDHGVPSDITQRWLSHTRSLRSQITRDEDGACND